MAVSYIASSTTTRNPTAATSKTVTNPGGATGDLMVLFMHRRDRYSSGDAGTPGGLSGWTNLFDTSAADQRFGVWYKDWASGDLTLTSLQSGVYYAMGLVVLRGHTTTGISYSAAATGTNTTVAGGSLTAASGDMLLSALATFGPFQNLSPCTITRPSGMTSTVTNYTTDATDLGGGYDYIHIDIDRESPSAGSTGTRSWAADDNTYDYAAMIVRNVIIPAAGATTHTAEATRSVTASTSGTVTADRSAAAAPSHTATVTASATVDRAAAATSATSVTVTADATVERSASASLAVTSTVSAEASGTVPVEASLSATATLTAAADVETPGVVTMDVTLAVTSTATAATALDASVAGTLAATASFAAEASTATVHEAQASRAVTAAINAAAAVLIGGVGDPGTMTLADIARATMKPATSSGATMRTVLVGFNTATMQAVLDDSASAPLLGVPVFVGDDDPVTLGLVTLTTAHVWFHDGTVTVREG